MDELHYSAQTVGSRDNTILAARIPAFTSGDTGGVAGLMVRDGADPSAANYYASVDPSGEMYVTARTSAGGATMSLAHAALTLPMYMRIKRASATGELTTELSDNGTTWYGLLNSGAILSLPSSFLQGFAVSSSGGQSLADAVFDHIAQNGGTIGSDIPDCADCLPGIQPVQPTGNGLINNQSQDVAQAPSLLPSAPAGGHALHFDGTDDAIVDGENLIGKGSYTVEFWANPDMQQRANATIMSTLFLPDRTGYALEQATAPDGRTDGYQWVVGGSNTGQDYYRTTAFSIPPGGWHHVAVEYQQTPGRTTGSIWVYVDGSLKAKSQNGSVPDVSYSSRSKILFLGKTACCTPGHWAGSIDDLRFSKIARYQQQHFSPPTHASVVDPSTVALFSFDEGDGNTIGSDVRYSTGPYAYDRFDYMLTHDRDGGELECFLSPREAQLCHSVKSFWVNSPLPPAPLSLTPLEAGFHVDWAPAFNAVGGFVENPSLYHWVMDIQLSKDRGLTFHDVSLNGRYVAQEMSVPFVTIATTLSSVDFPNGHSFKLAPNSGGIDRSRLIDFHLIQDGENLNVVATFKVDNLSKKAENQPSSQSQSAVFITQRYAFSQPFIEKRRPDRACEPSQDPLVGSQFILGFTCAFWRPTIHYTFVAAPGDALTRIQTGQRFVYMPDHRPLHGEVIIHDCAQQGDPGTKAEPCYFPVILGKGLSGLDAEPDPVGDNNQPLPPCEFPSALIVDCVPGPGTKLMENKNPLTHQVMIPIILKGGVARTATGDTWDNLHLTANSSGKITLPVPIPPGCLDCIHTHWRWDGFFENPTFGSGSPLIPHGSTQSAQIAVVAGEQCQGHAPGSVRCYTNDDLDNVDQLQKVVGNKDFQGPINTHGLAFWYVASGTQNDDVFFEHGSFVDPDAHST